MTARACFCASCWQTFASLSGFDDHRTGQYQNTPPHYGRRCRTPVELEERGYTLKNDGCWHTAPPANRPAHWRIGGSSQRERPVSVADPAELDAGEGAE